MEAKAKEEARQREKEEKARAREAARKKDSKDSKEQNPAVTDKPAGPNSTPGQPPVLTGSREEKLKQLLEAYRTGAISAADYHKERAKVLAQ
jgi:hypothetical protein